MHSPRLLATRPALLRAFSILCLLALGSAAPAGAAPFTVSNTNDSGTGSLRQAIIDANNAGSTDEIRFDDTLVVGPFTITLESALPAIEGSVTIDGQDVAGVTIDGDGLYRVFFVDSGTVEIANLDVTGGLAEGGAGAGGGGGGLGAGGGLFVASDARVTLSNVVFDGHTAEGGEGGAGNGGGGGGLGGVGGNDAGGGGGFGVDDDGEDGDGTDGGKGGGTLGGLGGVSGGNGADGGDGGGGGGATGTAEAGNGGRFGGGGGATGDATAGDGGFGGGGGGADSGGTAGLGGFGGGDGSTSGLGHGGSGYGGAVFVMEGGTLSIVDSSLGSTARPNSVTAGTGASSGEQEGEDLFLQTGVEVGIDVSTGEQTLYGSVSGEGSLRKFGTGTLRLQGANDYSGGTYLDAGTLVGNTASLQGEIVTQDATTLAFRLGPGENGTHTDSITGGGTLEKRGSGTLTLAGDYSYSGGTIVARGWLVGTTSTLQGDFTVDSNGTLVFDHDVNVSGTFAGVIDGSGGIEKRGEGTVTLSGANTYGGGTSILQGTLRGDATSLPELGWIDVAAGATLVFDQSGTGTYQGDISGDGEVIKEGSGELVMSGTRSDEGTTTVAAGRLSLTGSILRDVVVQSGGTFGGNGSVDGLVTVNGTLAPGRVGDYETLTAGSVDFNTGSRFEVELDPGSSDSDNLLVTGTATIDGGVVSVRPGSGSFETDRTYTILSAGSIDSPVSFPWAVDQDFHFFDTSVALNGSQVDLTVTPNPGATYSSAHETANQLAVGTVLDAQGDTSDLGSVLEVLYSLPTSDLRQAMDEIGGEALTSFTTAQLANGQKFTGAVTSRLGLVGGRAIGSPGTVDLVASLRATQQGPTQGLTGWAPVQLAMAGGLDSARTLQLAVAGPAISSPLPDERRRVGLWLDGYGLLGGVDGDGNTAKTKWTVPGVVGGLDVALGRRGVLGLAAGWARLDLDVKGRNMNGEADVFQGGLYGAYVGERLYVGGLARYAYTSYDTSRHVVFGSGGNVIDETLTADYKGNDVGGYLEAGYVAWAPAGFQIEPMAAFDYTWLQRESFVESGAEPEDPLALDVDKATWNSLLGSVGFRVHKSISLDEDEGLRMLPELSARYAHQFGDRDRPLDARIIGADPGTGSFQVVGASASSYGAILGLGWSVVRDDNLALFVQYDLNWNRDLLGHALALGLLVRF